MNPSRIAFTSSLICIGAWTVKAIAIGVAGGLGRSPLESPLFLLGLVAFVATVVLLALALSAGRAAGVRVLVVVGAVAAGVAFSVASNALVTAVRPANPSWVWGEVNLWVGAAVLLALVLATARNRGAAHA